MENKIPINNYTNEDDTINFKEFLQKIKKTWYWFIIFALLGLSGAYIVNKTIPPQFNIQSTLLVTDNSENSGIYNIFETAVFRTQTNIQDHIGILGSYTITRQALENLDWRVTWYENVFFAEIDLYNFSPFRIENFNPLLNLPQVRVFVSPIDNDYCILSVNEKLKIGQIEKKIKFEEEYKFGDTLQNEYFNFVLNKEVGRSIDFSKKYYFVINDLSLLTKLYQSRLNISLTADESNLIRLEIQGIQPKREIDFLNELNQVFVNFGLREKNRISENTVNFIDAQLSGIVDSLQSAGRSFTNFRSRNRIVDLSQEAELAVQSLEEIESEESMAQMRLEYYQNLLAYLDDADRMEQVIAPSVVGITDPALNSMVVSLGELLNRKSTLSFSVQEKNPSLLALENEINYMRESLEENLQNLIVNTELQLTSLRSRKTQINNELTQLPRTEQDLSNIKRQFDLNNELYTFLLQQRAEAAIKKASNVPDVQVLDMARMDTVMAIGPSNLVNYVIGLVLGIGIQILIIILTDYFDRTIKTREDIEKETDIPVLNDIGHSERKNDLPVLSNPNSAISESFRIVRTNLDYLIGKDKRKVIAVHSSIPGEGKTFFAINLASIIANNNKNVLLINADLRKPRIHSIFNIPNDKGLSSYLINKNKIDDIIVTSKVKNLTLIPSGPIPPNPAELLGNGNLKVLIQKAKEYFDYIIIDNAPATVVTDAVIVGEFVDINLFVIRSEYTNKEQIRFINQFSKLGTMKNIAIVLNDVKSNKSGYSHYYEKSYYMKKVTQSKKKVDKVPNKILNN